MDTEEEKEKGRRKKEEGVVGGGGSRRGSIVDSGAAMDGGPGPPSPVEPRRLARRRTSTLDSFTEGFHQLQGFDQLQGASHGRRSAPPGLGSSRAARVQFTLLL